MSVKGTVGSILINQELPKDLKDIGRELTGKKLTLLLRELAQKHPDAYIKATSALNKYGQEFAYKLGGASFGIDDLYIFDKKHKVLKDVDPTNATKLVAADDKISKELQKELKKTNPLHDWINSGARGKPSDLKLLVSGPHAIGDMMMNPVSHKIESSFVEGLNPLEYFAMSYGSKRALADVKMATRDPGALAKELVNTNSDFTVKREDCGTKVGQESNIASAATDFHYVDRHLAEAVKKNGKIIANRNTLISTTLLESFRKMGIKNIEVRSPLNCLVPAGVCKKCMGLNEDGNEYGIGDFLGVKLSQSLLEPLTQSAISSKHKAGVIEKGTKTTGFFAVRKMLQVPKNFVDAAVLSRVSGKVKTIKKLGGGERRITIGSEEHLVSPDLDLAVKVGDRVKKGDELSTGLFNIATAGKLMPPLELQRKFSNSLSTIYQGLGIKVKKNALEALSKSFLDYSKIIDPGDSEYVPGEVVRMSVITDRFSGKKKLLPIRETKGWRLANPTLNMKKGDIIDSKAVSIMSNNGLQKIEVFKKSPTLQPEPIGIKVIPTKKEDWLGAMGFSKIKDVLRNGAIYGRKSDLASGDPISSFAYGVDFNQAGFERSK